LVVELCVRELRVRCRRNMLACNLCGAEAVPKRILELMGVHGLARETTCR
jgi:hypothetical protein